jgi:hypothetical protein
MKASEAYNIDTGRYFRNVSILESITRCKYDLRLLNEKLNQLRDQLNAEKEIDTSVAKDIYTLYGKISKRKSKLDELKKIAHKYHLDKYI